MSRRYETALAKFNEELAKLHVDAESTNSLTRETARALRASEINRAQANGFSLATQSRRRSEQTRRKIIAAGLENVLAKLAEVEAKQ